MELPQPLPSEVLLPCRVKVRGNAGAKHLLPAPGSKKESEQGKHNQKNPFFHGIKSRRCPPAMGGCPSELHCESTCAATAPLQGALGILHSGGEVGLTCVVWTHAQPWTEDWGGQRWPQGPRDLCCRQEPPLLVIPVLLSKRSVGN